MISTHKTQCCGLVELSGVTTSTPQSCMHLLLPKILPYTFAIFSCPIKSEGGTLWRDFILENKMGEIFTSPTRNNFKSGNDLQVFLWTIDRNSMEDWLKTYYKVGQPVTLCGECDGAPLRGESGVIVALNFGNRLPVGVQFNNDGGLQSKYLHDKILGNGTQNQRWCEIESIQKI